MTNFSLAKWEMVQSTAAVSDVSTYLLPPHNKESDLSPLSPFPLSPLPSPVWSPEERDMWQPGPTVERQSEGCRSQRSVREDHKLSCSTKVGFYVQVSLQVVQYVG